MAQRANFVRLVDSGVVSVASRTLRSAIFGFANDYGTDPRSPELQAPWLSVSCVVPYYETGALAIECVRRLSRALSHYESLAPEAPPTQIVVVDDGSTREPFVDEGITGVAVIRSPVNEGRAAARNTGLLASADFDVAVFVDSDVLVQEDQIERICELWDAGDHVGRARPIVVANLFTTLRVDPFAIDLDRVLASASVQGDWRWGCRYQPTWIGCPGDWEYVGRSFNLMTDTNFLRGWAGMVGPWALPNMVLGGCFAVPAAAAIALGGFDGSFSAYGFTETSLVARLVASGVSVAPQVKSAAVHVEHHPAHHQQEQRDALLRVAHRKFFTEFLAHEI